MKSGINLASAAALSVGLVWFGGAAQAGHTFSVGHGQTVGPVVISNPTAPLPTTGVVNNGTINGGTSTGVTISGPTPTTIVNNGAITSSTRGISVSGSSSSSIVNTGTIQVGTSSTGSSASSSVGTGISQKASP